MKNKIKLCKKCGKKLENRQNNAIYHKECANEINNTYSREYQKKRRRNDKLVDGTMRNENE